MLISNYNNIKNKQQRRRRRHRVGGWFLYFYQRGGQEPGNVASLCSYNPPSLLFSSSCCSCVCTESTHHRSIHWRRRRRRRWLSSSFQSLNIIIQGEWERGCWADRPSVRRYARASFRPFPRVSVRQSVSEYWRTLVWPSFIIGCIHLFLLLFMIYAAAHSTTCILVYLFFLSFRLQQWRQLSARAHKAATRPNQTKYNNHLAPDRPTDRPPSSLSQ